MQRDVGAVALAVAMVVLLAMATSTCNGDDVPEGTGAAAHDGGDGASGGDGGGGGSTPTECIPAVATPDPVGDDCGLFVSSSLGDDGNAGTKAAPLATITEALSQAAGRPIYLCAESFDEAVTLAAPTELYGGLDCTSDWAWIGDDTPTALTAAADTIVLSVESSADGTVVADFAITARNAATAGASSIAALVDRATVSFDRCSFTAGNGVAGAEGNTPTGGDLDGVAGAQGDAANCAGSQTTGGLGGQ